MNEDERVSRALYEQQVAFEREFLQQQADLFACRILLQAVLLNIMHKTTDGQRIVDDLRTQAVQMVGSLVLSGKNPESDAKLRELLAGRIEQFFLDLERSAGLKPGDRTKLS